MAMRPFLAMTATELQKNTSIPEKIAWMACHFSPYGRGLSNLPRSLPKGSLLMIDDITPIRGHDAEVIAQQLIQCTELMEIYGILLDFQQPKCSEVIELINYLSKALPYPLAVSDIYADDVDLPVFVSPAPPSVALQEHLSPWTGREIWLDVSYLGESLRLTESGCRSLPLTDTPDDGFSDPLLHCHYRITQAESEVTLDLWRSQEDLWDLMEEGNALGVTNVVGLYQEFQRFGI